MDFNKRDNGISAREWDVDDTLTRKRDVREEDIVCMTVRGSLNR